MSLANALANIPGLAGWEAGRQMGEQTQANQLRQVSGIMGLQQALQAQQERQRALAEQQQLKQTLGGAGSPQEAIQKLIASGNPQAIALAAKLQGLIPKPAGDKVVSAGGAIVGPDGTVKYQAPFKPDKEPPLPDFVRLQDYLATLPQSDPRRPAIESYIKRHTERAPAAPAPVTSVIVKDPASPTGWSHADARTGRITVKGAPRPRTSEGGADGVSVPAAPAGESAIAPGTNIPSATGGSGFFGGIANTVADMVGSKLPYPDIEQATQALKNLQVQTVTLLQDAVPGRPSNYLLKQLEDLAVKPGSLLMADQRAKERLSSTKGMLQAEVKRIENEVLARPQQFTAAQLGKARNSHGQLRQLLAEYDTVINSFNSMGPVTQGAVRPAPGAGIKFLGFE